ncbi:hypothetical protein EMIHUDRAFT_220608 [Emiliania huxleyi CCMP1516]|uniref:Beta-lactamase-related domain-containing protein n=2 Tax=Emiliania huxleyi TaxID=2903 RepID=A0A0D3I0P8_EMIH1|nr:hypothetical protein EMIHUDRAFT_220608 [Emiliania huxleyi CCMP1516]EOD04833.1 hypothetical protein EMIHUDRAFT_220608 [Emiliania huxleyi CCMP1516]|eukprot:XP_005757262.1 hypothetical protein EMIHUDRAFT_220608 [Emiliania huxleyi CCMP1516]
MGGRHAATTQGFLLLSGVKVVDLWGGYRDRGAQAPWEEPTLAPVFSTTKGVTAFALAIQKSRGAIDYDGKVAQWWPEFAQNGKEDVTVRQLISHECGLAGPAPPIALATLRDKAATRAFFAAAPMEWRTPGDYKGYMAVTLGNFESALVQMSDGERRRSAGELLRDECFAPLGIEDEIYVGTPASVPDARFAVIDGMSGLEPLFADSFPPGFVRRLLLEPRSYTARAFANPRLSAPPSVLDYNRRELGYCYVPNRCSGYILDDPREMALRTKVWRCAQRAGGYSGARALPLARLSVPHELAARDVARFPYLAPLP